MENSIVRILKYFEQVDRITFKCQGETEEVGLFEEHRVPAMAIQKTESINASPSQNPLKREKGDLGMTVFVRKTMC